MSSGIRILLVADSHLGFDLPERPRVARRRRGHDFIANYALALAPALAGEVDIVVHAGDVFDRPDVSTSLAYQAFNPLRRIADLGVPVFIVPGNHERSRLPHSRFAAHPHVHVFDTARTFVLEMRGTKIALTGFPYERRAVRTSFGELLARSDWQSARAPLRLLCIHHCVEGATVGPADFMFTGASDVIRIRDVPSDFVAVLSGHIHRHQVLTRDLRNRPVATPVMYPGSIERTAFAEIGEPKGFMILHLDETANGPRVRWEFRHLPARPMFVKELAADGLNATALESAVRALVAAAPADAVLTIRIAGDVTAAHLKSVSAARLRTFVPPSMNLEISVPSVMQRVRYVPRAAAARADSVQRTEDTGLQLELGS
jgi:exonuclease SbcD